MLVPGRETEKTTLPYLKFGGGHGEVTGDRLNLGMGVERRNGRNNWLFHIALGYASGYPVSAIFYFWLTRDTLPIMLHWAWKRERAEFEAANGQKWPACSPSCRFCKATA